MPNYKYIAWRANPTRRNERESIVEGNYTCSGPTQLQDWLNAEGLKLVAFESKSDTGRLLNLGRRVREVFEYCIPTRKVHVELLLNQLVVMLQSGLTLVQVLETLSQQAETKRLRDACSAMAQDIRDGECFAGAMARHGFFPKLVVQLVRVGEETGQLEQVLQRATQHIARKRKMISRVLTALAYPSFVAVAAMAVAAYMVVVVIPELEKLLGAMGRKLPAMTQSLVEIARFVEVHGTAVTVALIAAASMLLLVYRHPKCRLIMDRYLLRLPVLGQVLKLSGGFMFSSAMAVMLKSGITMKDALNIVRLLQQNQAMAAQTVAARKAVLKGHGLAEILRADGSYTPMVSRMIAVGEESGDLVRALEHVAEYQESQLDMRLKAYSSLIEPAIIVLVGGIVAYVYVAFFVSILGTGGNFR